MQKKSKQYWNKIYNNLTENWIIEDNTQEFSSAKTSRKQIASLHKYLIKNNLVPENSFVVDWGGGKYDLSKDFYIQNIKDVKFYTYDPFNRPEKHNNNVLKAIQENNGADIITLANVLNVIKEKQIRIDTLIQIKNKLKNNGSLYISVYNAIKSDNYKETDTTVGQQTKDGWQNAQSIDFYLPEVKQIFSNSQIKNNIIIARK